MAPDPMSFWPGTMSPNLTKDAMVKVTIIIIIIMMMIMTKTMMTCWQTRLWWEWQRWSSMMRPGPILRNHIWFIIIIITTIIIITVTTNQQVEPRGVEGEVLENFLFLRKRFDFKQLEPVLWLYFAKYGKLLRIMSGSKISDKLQEI